MGQFTEFVNQKLLKEEAKKVSSNLLKNVIDVVKEYVSTEFTELSEDEKMQIINNMEIGVEENGKGVLKKSPRFVASSSYNEKEGKSTPVEITVELVTEKLGGGSAEESPAEEPEESEAPEVGGEEE